MTSHHSQYVSHNNHYANEHTNGSGRSGPTEHQRGKTNLMDNPALEAATLEHSEPRPEQHSDNAHLASRCANGRCATPEVEPGEESYDAHFESLISQMLTRIGETPERDGLKQTPLRVAKAMDYLTSGYTTNLNEVINDAVFKDDGEEMVLVKDIEFYSLCEHHLLPFFGSVHIAYIPNGKIIGLSKLARVADVFARRLQVQERLTNQIADALDEILQPRGVAVVAEAAHFCMMMRGVQKQNSTTMTSAMRGVFKDDLQQRDQFMRLIGK